MATSPGDYEAVNAIASEIDGPTICSLARCNESDIEKAYEALKVNKNRRIHVFVATSEIHLKHKLNMAKDEVLVVEGVKMAKSFVIMLSFQQKMLQELIMVFSQKWSMPQLKLAPQQLMFPIQLVTQSHMSHELFKHLIETVAMQRRLFLVFTVTMTSAFQ